MLFTQDRDKSRQIFFECWQKHLNGVALEPLESQILSVIQEHPEYHALLSDRENNLSRDFVDSHTQENPFLHMSLHLALREQVGTDRPAGIASITRSLLLKHQDGHHVEHLMIEKLGQCLWDAQRSALPPDEQSYLESLKQLI